MQPPLTRALLLLRVWGLLSSPSAEEAVPTTFPDLHFLGTLKTACACPRLAATEGRMSWSCLLVYLPVSWVQDLVWDWQQAASGVLVAVGRQFISKVMEELLRRLHPGTLPHCAVLHTLASLSVANGR